MLARIVRPIVRSALLAFTAAVVADSAAADPEQGLPLIRTLSPAMFDTPATPVGSQIFALLRAPDGSLLAANNEGLLRLDGSGWRTWDPLRGAILGMDDRADGRVFVGGVDDLGYFDRFGENFVSLRDWSKRLGKPFGEFWVVLAGEHATHFVDRERAYRWDGKRMQLVYEAHGETRQGALLAGEAVVLDPAAGLIRLESSPARAIAGSEVLTAAHDCALGETGTQVVTVCDDDALRIWNLAGLARTIRLQDGLQRQLAVARPSALATTANGGYAIATRQGGVFLLDAQGELQGRIGQGTGLDNVRIFSLLAAGADGLWLGRDHGLAMIEWPGQVSRYDIDLGLPRIPLGVGRVGGKLFVATSAGVYRLDPGPDGFVHAQPQAMIGDVLFDVIESPDALLIPAREGLYAFEASGEAKRIDPRLSYVALYMDGLPPHLIVGGDDGAWVLEKGSGGWHAVGDVPGVHSEIRRIVPDGPTSVWLSSRASRLLFHMTWTDRGEGAAWNSAGVHVDDETHAPGLPTGPITPVTLQDGLAFASAEGLYRYDAPRRRFVPDRVLNGLLPIENGVVRQALPLDMQRVIVAQHDRYRVLRHSVFGWVEETTSLARIPRGAVPRSLYRDADGALWITTSDAVYRHLPESQSALPSLPAPRVALDRGHGDEPLNAANGSPMRLGVAPMRLSFRFSSAIHVGADRVSYRTRLVPLESGWSEWSTRSVLELSYVPGGDFALEVQARDLFDRTSRITRVNLHLDRPWYQRWWAWMLYVAASLMVIAFVVRRRDRRLRSRARELEALVRERTQELEKASVTDQLTGLHNRHYFEIATRQLLDHEERILVALIDLDHFKKVNDTRGHDVGDMVLTDVSRRLLAVAPGDAVLFRWGGEEFLLLAPLGGEDRPEAIIVEILHRVGDVPVELGAAAATPTMAGAGSTGALSSTLAMTCSIGWEIAAVAESPAIREALRRADLHLYDAKHSGRDRAHGPDGVVGTRPAR
jgi:diguanylate cyclase (GGDEF)-like protein